MPDVTPVIDQLDVTPVIDQTLVNMLRSSLRFQDPLIETDPVYTYTDYDLWEILLLVTPIYNKKCRKEYFLEKAYEWIDTI